MRDDRVSNLLKRARGHLAMGCLGEHSKLVDDLCETIERLSPTAVAPPTDGPMSIVCPTCHAAVGERCSSRYVPVTMGDYDAEFHEERRPT